MKCPLKRTYSSNNVNTHSRSGILKRDFMLSCTSVCARPIRWHINIYVYVYRMMGRFTRISVFVCRWIRGCSSSPRYVSRMFRLIRVCMFQTITVISNVFPAAASKDRSQRCLVAGYISMYLHIRVYMWNRIKRNKMYSFVHVVTRFFNLLTKNNHLYRHKFYLIPIFWIILSIIFKRIKNLCLTIVN